jgi:hypothetical protein
MGLLFPRRKPKTSSYTKYRGRVKNLMIGMFAVLVVSCSSKSVLEEKKEMGFWEKTKCKIMNNNSLCE